MIELTRFMSKIERQGECWVWTAAMSHGNPVMSVKGRSRQARRFIYSQHHELGNSEKLFDTCGDKRCVNPDHLTVTSQKEINAIRRKATEQDRELVRALITKPWREVFA